MHRVIFMSDNPKQMPFTVLCYRNDEDGLRTRNLYHTHGTSFSQVIGEAKQVLASQVWNAAKSWQIPCYVQINLPVLFFTAKAGRYEFSTLYNSGVENVLCYGKCPKDWNISTKLWDERSQQDFDMLMAEFERALAIEKSLEL